MPLPDAAVEARRIQLWRKQEWHNWFRWWLCRKGFDWSKVIVIGALVVGFAALISYGFIYDRWYVTAGGIVGWFTLVNLSFFVYFGLTLPGPPLALPGPVPEGRYRAEMGLYPAGYERRKLPRIWLRIGSLRFEFAVQQLDPDLASLIKEQTLWRMQRGDAPLTQAVVEFSTVTREQLDSGVIPVRVIAWNWNPQSLEPFNRARIS